MALASASGTMLTAQHVGIGTATPASRVEIRSTGNTSATSALNITDSTGTSLMFISDDGSVGIGTTAPSANLHIAGTFRLADGSEGLGKVLTSDADGNATWEVVSTGGGTLDDAYDFGGAGAGRIIEADAGVVSIQGTDGFEVTGAFGSGAGIGTPGQGTRMFFNPNKAAFRVGYVDFDEWDESNVGDYSIAMGGLTIADGDYAVAFGEEAWASGYASVAIGGGLPRASGNYAVALGETAVASGINSVAIGRYASASADYSVALGLQSTASGIRSVAIGREVTASNNSSVAIGYQSYATGTTSRAFGHQAYATGFHATSIGDSTTASGRNSVAFGTWTTAKSAYETALGRWNTDYTPASTNSWNSADRLLVVGNGTASASRSDALVILKSGNTGIGTSTPSERLDVLGNIQFSGALMPDSVSGSAGQVLTSAGSGSAPVWTDPTEGTVTSIGTGTGLTGGPITSSGTISLDVPIAVADGGTGTTTEFNTGSVVFAGTGGGYTENSSQLYWDTTNNRLGIGTSSPSHKLHVTGAIRTSSGISANDGTINLISYRFTNDASTGMFMSDVGYLRFATDGVERVTIDPNGNVGIDTTNPQRPLHVNDVLRLEPRATAPSSPSAGDIYFDSIDNRIKVYNDTIWRTVEWQ